MTQMTSDRESTTTTLAGEHTSQQSDGSLAVSANIDPNSDDILVTITPPKEGERTALNLCCIIDISGSMATKASVPSDLDTEKTDLCVLDIVKHSVRTIMAAMDEKDQISLVFFASKARLALDFTVMNEAGKKKVSETLDNARPEDATNLWHGLKLGMETLKKEHGRFKSKYVLSQQKPATPLSSLFILTDGMPNVEPPRGHIPMLQNWIDNNGLTFSLHTFGFGYSLDSKLLLDIAKIGGGGYFFIPDSGMVGTVFVHAVANVLTTWARGVTLDIDFMADDQQIVFIGADLADVRGDTQVVVGDVQFGQTRDFVLRVPGYKEMIHKTPLCVIVRYTTVASEAVGAVELHLSDVSSRGGENSLALLKYHTLRLTFVEKVRQVMTASGHPNHQSPSGPSTSVPSLEDGRMVIQHLLDQSSEDLQHIQRASSSALREDIKGQALFAVSNEEYYLKWGAHYLPSLARAHSRQQASNFKDPGVQIYGSNSPLFVRLRNQLDAAFDSLPPPTPTSHGGAAPLSRGTGLFRASTSKTTTRSRTSMATWNRAHAPCFHGDCRVRLSNGTLKKLTNVCRGDVLSNGQCIAAVLKTPIFEGITTLCDVGDLKVTAWHPIFNEKTQEWVFPASIAQPTLQPCDAVYSILLEHSDNPDMHVAVIENVRCVTLGHGLTRSQEGMQDARVHSFFGDYSRVISSISRLEGFHLDEGVVLAGGITRGGEEMLVNGFFAADSPVGVHTTGMTSVMVV